MLNVKIFTFNPLQENTYIIHNEHGNCIIIDPGCYDDREREQLTSFITSNGLQPKMLVNTHCHLDHVFGNKFIHDTYGLELHIHPEERPVLEYAPTSGLMWNLPFDNYAGPIHDLTPGTMLKLNDDELALLFTPGHSPASISFYDEKDRFVISGDVLFRESVGRTDLPGGNTDVLIQSIREQLYTLSDDTVVYPGHGMPTRIGHEKGNNPFVTG